MEHFFRRSRHQTACAATPFNTAIASRSWANQMVCLPCAASAAEQRGRDNDESIACSKRRKVDAENRCFKEKWTEKCMFILPASSSKPVCLICSESVAVIKSGNVKRHYESKHSSFEQSYPLKSELRARKITELQAQYDRSTRLITFYIYIYSPATCKRMLTKGIVDFGAT